MTLCYLKEMFGKKPGRGEEISDQEPVVRLPRARLFQGPEDVPHSKNNRD
jgi:hypothetical protein